MALYLFHGQEEFLIEKEIKKLKSKLLDKSFLSMNYRTYDSPLFPDLMDILSTQPMMFGNILIVINCNEYFDLKAEEFGFDTKQYAQIETALKTVPEQINIVFVHTSPRESKKKIDTKRKLYKILAQVCKEQEFKQLRTFDKQLPTVITKLGKENELTLTSENTTKIIETLGTNLRIIDSELKKLKLYIYPKTTPSNNDIENICNYSKNVFKLLDFFILSEKSKAINELNLLMQTQHPLQILALMQTNISKFINLKLLSRTMNAFEISRKLNLYIDIIKNDLDKIKSYKYDELLQIKKNIIECSYKIKTGQIYSDELAIEQLILNKAD